MNKLIDADAVINAVYERIKQIGYENDPLVLSIRQTIRELPTVDAVPVRHGRWVHHWDDHDDWLECSECGYGDEGEVMLNQRTNFCPNCGARMDGKDGDQT